MNKLRVVLLAAGSGSRFEGKGYPDAKQFLPIQGSCAIVSAIQLANAIDNNPVLVYSESLTSSFWKVTNAYLATSLNIGTMLQRRMLTYTPVPVRVLQPGPAYSALLAGGFLEDTDPVLFLDTDSYFTAPETTGDVIEAVFLQFLEKGYQCGVLVTDVDTHHTVADEDLRQFSRVVLDEERVVKHVKTGEESDSHVINVGGYFFSSWGLFRKALFESERTSPESSKERTMLDVLTQVDPCVAVNVPSSCWYSIGTPELYEETLAHFKSYEG